MEQKTGNGNYFDSTSLFEFFWRWRMPLIVIGLAAAVISAGVSYLIPERYKSTVIMFPVQSNAIAKALLTEDFSGKQDVLQFGEEEQAEQLLQILHSDEIRSRITEKHGLMKHYRIDPSDPYKNTRLYEKYSENITFKRTEFMSVKIEVLDEDPKLASKIANDIADLLDSTKARMQRDRAEQALAIVETEYRRKQAEVQLMADSMAALNALGMYDYESQSEVTSQQYAIALAKGDQGAIKRLAEHLDILSKYGSAYMSIRENLYIQREQLNLLKKKYDEAKIDAEAVLTYRFIVNKAFPAERKSHPVRWLIVAVSTTAALVFGVLMLILFDNIRSLRKRTVTTGNESAG
jgi:LPS O-antigen subunit length determinant protein (WzzB/FepE family)